MPSLLTLGICYEERPRLSGGAYQSVLRRIDEFLEGFPSVSREHVIAFLEQAKDRLVASVS